MIEKHPPYKLVKDKKTLSRIVVELKKEHELGVDVEADSMFHYQEKVCLIQISTPPRNILIDPLSFDDLSPLAPIFSASHIRKVFHGADYDIRSLYRDFGFVINNLFDTHIAARFLGIMETGLAPLLKNRLGITLDKKYQKRDWSIRPLSPGMLAYAVNDTSHLLPLSRMLESELRDKNRLLWVDEECRRLSEVRPVPPDGNPLFLKFKNARKLHPRDLAVLESILQLRDHTAKHRDRPPFKILGNESILDIAEKKPASKDEIKRIKGLSAGQAKKLGPSILKRVAESLALPENQLPRFPRKANQKTHAGISKGVKALKTWREKQAREMNMDPALILTNAQIEALAQVLPKERKDLEDIDSLRAWQVKQYGKEICNLLR
jgi:ribonuclease D